MKKFFMGMIAAIVCGTAFAGNLNEIKASAVSDDDVSTSTPDRLYLLSMVQRLQLTQTILAREQLSESAEP